MARLFLPPVLLAFSLAAAALILNAGVAEAFSCQWQGTTPPAPPTGSNYSSFVCAAEWFPESGSGAHHVDADTRKREVAVFLAQISHETTGGWATAPDGPYRGPLLLEEINASSNYCDADNKEWPCVDGKSYHGRGPMQLSCLICQELQLRAGGEALCFDGLGNPEVVASDPDVASLPSCHDVMLGRYAHRGRQAGQPDGGFGLTTNIINGGLECNRTGDPRVEDRIGYYRRYCEILKVDDLGDNLDCAQQLPYCNRYTQQQFGRC
ncbi:hypothetical protein ZWY2020_011279 [Hordeum vulgare]|nr:hypothetical protein ZWY2020_011279 [Hordeum vulgare]